MMNKKITIGKKMRNFVYSLYMLHTYIIRARLRPHVEIYKPTTHTETAEIHTFRSHRQVLSATCNLLSKNTTLPIATQFIQCCDAVRSEENA